METNTLPFCPQEAKALSYQTVRPKAFQNRMSTPQRLLISNTIMSSTPKKDVDVSVRYISDRYDVGIRLWNALRRNLVAPSPRMKVFSFKAFRLETSCQTLGGPRICSVAAYYKSSRVRMSHLPCDEHTRPVAKGRSGVP